MVSAKGKFVFVVGETSGGSFGSGSRRGRKTKKKRAVIAVWNGRKRGKIYPGYGGEKDPTRLLSGHGGAIQSIYTPDNPGDVHTADTFSVHTHCGIAHRTSCDGCQ